ncbi:MAG: hypothetical protein U0Q19_17790 [Kineosporiaceae bacterium]
MGETDGVRLGLGVRLGVGLGVRLGEGDAPAWTRIRLFAWLLPGLASTPTPG